MPDRKRLWIADKYCIFCLLFFGILSFLSVLSQKDSSEKKNVRYFREIWLEKKIKTPTKIHQQFSKMATKSKVLNIVLLFLGRSSWRMEKPSSVLIASCCLLALLRILPVSSLFFRQFFQQKIERKKKSGKKCIILLARMAFRDNAFSYVLNGFSS